MSGLVFLGTPAAAVPVLDRVAATGDLRLVITMPDRPRGRSKTPKPPPVKEWALQRGVPVAQPADRAELVATFEQLEDVELGIVVAYGRIIPPAAFELPQHGLVNVHFSLLPRWRGAAPVERAMLAGDLVTGVSLMAIEAGLDTGSVYAVWATSIGRGETAGELTARLAMGGAELLGHHLDQLRTGSLAGAPQAADRATHAAKLTVEEARLDLHEPADAVLRRIHAFNPRPGAHCTLGGERFKIWTARLASASLAPGVLDFDGTRLVVGTATEALELTEVQPAGSRRMEGAAWARGRSDALGQLR